MNKFLFGFVIAIFLVGASHSVVGAKNLGDLSGNDTSGIVNEVNKNFIYDNVGRVIRENFGNKNFIEYTYDKNGNLISQKITKNTVGNTAPILTEIKAIISPTIDSTPEYVFNSTKNGVITYFGSCTSVKVDAVKGDNTIILDELEVGTYDDCAISVTDDMGNSSEKLSISEFSVKNSNNEIQQKDEESEGKNNATNKDKGDYAIVKTGIYRLYNTKTGGHLYTRGVADRDKILKKYKDFEFTDNMPAFYASLTDDGTTPIYRLYNTKRGGHFYAVGTANRDEVLDRWKDFEFTDNMPAFYASMTNNK